MRNPRKNKPRSSFFLFVDTKFCPRTRLWYNKIQEHNRISYKLVSASIPPPFLLLPSAIQDRIPASRNCEAEFREGGNLLTWIENWKSRMKHRRKGFLLINLREVIGRVVIGGVKERKEKERGKLAGEIPFVWTRQPMRLRVFTSRAQLFILSTLFSRSRSRRESFKPTQVNPSLSENVSLCSCYIGASFQLFERDWRVVARAELDKWFGQCVRK